MNTKEKWIVQRKICKGMEDYQINKNTNNKDAEPTWDLDDAHIQHLKELGLWDGDDGDEFIDTI